VHLKADWKQLSLAHSATVKTDMPEKNGKQLESVESVRWVKKVEELWRKRFVEKMSFEPGVEERSSNGW